MYLIQHQPHMLFRYLALILAGLLLDFEVIYQFFTHTLPNPIGVARATEYVLAIQLPIISISCQKYSNFHAVLPIIYV